MLFLPEVYLQEVTKRKQTLICSDCPENVCPGAKPAIWLIVLVLHPLFLPLSARVHCDVPCLNLPGATWDGARETRVVSANSNEARRDFMPQHLN